MSTEYLPPLSSSVLESGTATGVKLPQGAKVDPGVLDIVFMDAQGDYVSPSSIFYAVCALDDFGYEHVIGIEDRLPLNVRTGRFSPNFIIGVKWYTGNYRLRWSYKISTLDTVLVRNIDFEVVSSGVYDVRMVGLGLFNIRATVLVVE